MPSSAAHQPTAFPVLIGDIGGTNARFGLIAEPDAPTEVFPSVMTADFPDIDSALEAVLAQSALRPRSAVIDVAGPITGDAVQITNASWLIRPPVTMPRMGLSDMVLLNDFEALALALTALDRADLEPIGGGAEVAGGTKVVVGPGTGLGVGALIKAGEIWTPVPGEGGHVEFGPAEPDEFPIWAHMEAEHGRIEAETFLCGRGIVQLYRAVAAVDGTAVGHAPPAAITEAALAGSDPTAVRTLELFCRFLGRFAGDIALIFMARGGVYLGGGISPRILPFLERGEFRRAFEAKAPHHRLMRTLPSWVITRENPALAGLSAFARSPERFAVSLEGRRWKAG